MPSPRVSICIPTWRVGDFLEAAIQSVLSQTFTDFELVVVDDCSGDDTVARVRKYAEDPRLRCLVNQDNLGPEGNWNRCLAEASGEYIKLLPHDDLIAPECLASAGGGGACHSEGP